MPYLIYLRKSRADQEAELRGEGETLARHRDTLLRLAKQRGYTIGAVYEEVVSGDTIASRPKMQQLLTEVEAGAWEGVICMEVERLARGDSIDQGIVARAFKYTDTLIITPVKTYDPSNEYDEEYFEFGLFMSRREYKTIRRRLNAGVQAARREGKFTGGAAPYGYQKQKLKGEKGGTLVPNPTTAPYVQEIFRWFTEDGMNMYQIAAQLNALQVPRPSGGLWYHKTVSLLLRNPHYAGYTTSSRRPVKTVIEDGEVKKIRPLVKAPELFEGRHEPLVSRDQWHKAQGMLQLHAAPPVPRGKGQTNAFTGLLYCAECNSKMQRNCFGTQKRSPILFCMTKGCSTISNDYSQIEGMVLDSLRNWLTEYSVLSAEPSAPALDHHHKALKQIAADLKMLDTREAKAFELVETGVYSPALYLDRKAAIDAERVALEGKQRAVTKEISVLQDEQRLRREFLPRVRHVLDAYGEAENAHEQNLLLKSVIVKIVYKKTRRTLPNAPSDLSLQVFPRLPSTPAPM